MSSVQRRDKGGEMAAMSPFSRLDRMFDEWMRSLPMRRTQGIMPWDLHGEDVISVDEYRDGDTQVIRAELPGIDPDKDVELSVVQGMLRIDAERRVEKDTEDKGYTRHELRYGRFTRSLPIPEGASADDITATYKDGILEVRVPVPAPPTPPSPTKIAISKG
jgi:HSP20 family protein